MTVRPGRLAADLVANYAAFAVTAVGGVAFLLVCAARLGMEGLGVVSQVMALFVIFGQVAVGGVQLSALHTAGDPRLDEGERRTRIWSAVCLAVAWGMLVATLAWATSGWAARALGSPRIQAAWGNAAPGLAFFALNKAVASSLNGLGRMGWFAVQLASRALLLLGLTWAVLRAGGDTTAVGHAFLGTEAALSVGLLTLLVRLAGRPAAGSLDRARLASHAAFGIRGLWSGLAFEINMRVDLLMVGLLLSDQAVGLYAIVAHGAEGLYNVIVVLRNQFAPTIARLVAFRDHGELRRFAGRILAAVVPATALLSAVGVALYGPAVEYALPGRGYGAAAPLLAILLLGLTINSWLIALDSILVVSGHPGLYSLVLVATMAGNALACRALIPPFGLHGAAAATAAATVLSGVVMLAAVRSRLGITLVPSVRLFRHR